MRFILLKTVSFRTSVFKSELREGEGSKETTTTLERTERVETDTGNKVVRKGTGPLTI